MRKAREIIGQKFGLLTVVAVAKKKTWDDRTLVVCSCDCGTKSHTARIDNMVRGKTKSCGCLRSPYFTKTHGLRNSRSYTTWKGIKQRCNNPKCKDFPLYGGRGITVCERWQKFENFYADMGDPPAGLSLDRVDNNSGYSPENCLWATPEQQANNTRKNRDITYHGRTQSVSRWAHELSLRASMLHLRIFRSGWPVEKAFTEPPRRQKRTKQREPQRKLISA